MFFYLVLIFGLVLIAVAIGFLAAICYHLSRYQLPGQPTRKVATIILFISLVLILLSASLFFIIPWESL